MTAVAASNAPSRPATCMSKECRESRKGAISKSSEGGREEASRRVKRVGNEAPAPR